MLEGRPGDELAWVAHLLSCALEAAPEARPVSVGAGVAAPGRSSVVPYESPADDPHSVRISRSQDGTLTVTLPPTVDEQVQRLVGYVFLLVILASIGAALLERLVLRGPRPLSIGAGAVVALIAYATARSLLRYVSRRRDATVIAADGQYVYLNRPAGLGRPQRWLRGQVVDVRDGRFNRRSIQCAELVLAGGITVPIAVGRDEWERRRVIAALREALAMWG